MKNFYFEPLWATAGLGTFYREYDEADCRESFEIYCTVDVDTVFADVSNLAEARFLIDGERYRLYLAQSEEALERLPCLSGVGCERASEVYKMTNSVYARTILMSSAFTGAGRIGIVRPTRFT